MAVSLVLLFGLTIAQCAANAAKLQLAEFLEAITAKFLKYSYTDDIWIGGHEIEELKHFMKNMELGMSKGSSH